MRFLLVSDLHYALKQYDWTTAVAPDFDSVVIAGDHVDISGIVDGSVQIVVILKYLKRLMGRTRLITSSAITIWIRGTPPAKRPQDGCAGYTRWEFRATETASRSAIY